MNTICCGCFKPTDTICLTPTWNEAVGAFETMNRCFSCVAPEYRALHDRFVLLRNTPEYRSNLVALDRDLTLKLAAFYDRYKLANLSAAIRDAAGYADRVDRCVILLEKLMTGELKLAMKLAPPPAGR